MEDAGSKASGTAKTIQAALLRQLLLAGRPSLASSLLEQTSEETLTVQEIEIEEAMGTSRTGGTKARVEGRIRSDERRRSASSSQQPATLHL